MSEAAFPGRTRSRGVVLVLIALGFTGCDSSDPMSGVDPVGDTTSVPLSDSLSGVWVPGPPLPGPRSRHAAVVYRGDLIVAGGLDGPGSFTASVIRLRPGATEWVELAPLPLQLAGLSLAVVRDTLFSVGGDGPFLGRPEQALFAYDPEADAWLRRRDVPDWRTFTEAVAVDDVLWLTGGQVRGRTTGEHGGQPAIRGDTILEYVPGEDAWTYGMALPTPRLDHEAVQAPGGLTYLVGGEHGEWSRPFPGVEVYDPATDEWSSIPDPFPTRRIAAAFAEPYIHVVGGEEYRDFHRALDVRTGRWAGLPTIPHPLEWSKLIRWEGALWLIGGNRTTEDGPRIVADVHRFDLHSPAATTRRR